jgi:hypothetical protein
MPPQDLVMFIPIIGTIMGVSLVMLIVYLDYRRRSEALRHSHEQRMAAIEKGIELPPPVAEPGPFKGFDNLDPLARREHLMIVGRISTIRQRRSGLVLVCVGAAITLAMWQTGIDDFWWGLVPAAIGIAQLLASLIESGEQRKVAAKRDETHPPMA